VPLLRSGGVSLARVCQTQRAWRISVLAETGDLTGAVEEGLSHERMLTTPDYVRAPPSSWMAAERLQVVVAGTVSDREASGRLLQAYEYLRALRLAGFQEIRPAFALAFASTGRCVYGHQAG